MSKAKSRSRRPFDRPAGIRSASRRPITSDAPGWDPADDAAATQEARANERATEFRDTAPPPKPNMAEVTSPGRTGPDHLDPRHPSEQESFAELHDEVADVTASDLLDVLDRGFMHCSPQDLYHGVGRMIVDGADESVSGQPKQVTASARQLVKTARGRGQEGLSGHVPLNSLCAAFVRAEADPAIFQALRGAGRIARAGQPPLGSTLGGDLWASPATLRRGILLTQTEDRQLRYIAEYVERAHLRGALADPRAALRRESSWRNARADLVDRIEANAPSPELQRPIAALAVNAADALSERTALHVFSARAAAAAGLPRTEAEAVCLALSSSRNQDADVERIFTDQDARPAQHITAAAPEKAVGAAALAYPDLPAAVRQLNPESPLAAVPDGAGPRWRASYASGIDDALAGSLQSGSLPGRGGQWVDDRPHTSRINPLDLVTSVALATDGVPLPEPVPAQKPGPAVLAPPDPDAGDFALPEHLVSRSPAAVARRVEALVRGVGEDLVHPVPSVSDATLVTAAEAGASGSPTPYRLRIPSSWCAASEDGSLRLDATVAPPEMQRRASRIVAGVSMTLSHSDHLTEGGNREASGYVTRRLRSRVFGQSFDSGDQPRTVYAAALEAAHGTLDAITDTIAENRALRAEKGRVAGVGIRAEAIGRIVSALDHFGYHVRRSDAGPDAAPGLVYPAAARSGARLGERTTHQPGDPAVPAGRAPLSAGLHVGRRLPAGTRSPDAPADPRRYGPEGRSYPVCAGDHPVGTIEPARASRGPDADRWIVRMPDRNVEGFRHVADAKKYATGPPPPGPGPYDPPPIVVPAPALEPPEQAWTDPAAASAARRIQDEALATIGAGVVSHRTAFARALDAHADRVADCVADAFSAGRFDLDPDSHRVPAVSPERLTGLSPLEASAVSAGAAFVAAAIDTRLEAVRPLISPTHGADRDPSRTADQHRAAVVTHVTQASCPLAAAASDPQAPPPPVTRLRAEMRDAVRSFARTALADEISQPLTDASRADSLGREYAASLSADPNAFHPLPLTDPADRSIPRVRGQTATASRTSSVGRAVAQPVYTAVVRSAAAEKARAEKERHDRAVERLTAAGVLEERPRRDPVPAPGRPAGPAEAPAPPAQATRPPVGAAAPAAPAASVVPPQRPGGGPAPASAQPSRRSVSEPAVPAGASGDRSGR